MQGYGHYELGLKGVFLDGIMDLRLAAFVMEWDDVQTTIFSQEILADFIGNASEASFEGFELEATFDFTDNLVLNVGVGYTDAEYDSFENGIIPTEPDPVDLSGTEIPLAPEWTVNTQLQYQWQPFSGSSAFVRAEYLYVDEQFTTAGGDEFNARKIDSYDVVNLRTGLTIGRYSISAFAENITDEYYLSGSRFGTYTLGLRSAINEGRRYGLRVAVAF